VKHTLLIKHVNETKQSNNRRWLANGLASNKDPAHHAQVRQRSHSPDLI